MVARKSAVKSVVIYNLVHLIGTVAAFLLAALLVPFLFPVSEDIRFICFSVVGICFFLGVFLFYLPAIAHGALKKRKFHCLHRVSLALRWSFHKILVFYRLHRVSLLLSIAVEILARFVEGNTFYFAFLVLGNYISPLSASFLDVGRAIADNIFFFIPTKWEAEN